MHPRLVTTVRVKTLAPAVLTLCTPIHNTSCQKVKNVLDICRSTNAKEMKNFWIFGMVTIFTDPQQQLPKKV